MMYVFITDKGLKGLYGLKDNEYIGNKVVAASVLGERCSRSRSVGQDMERKKFFPEDYIHIFC